MTEVESYLVTGTWRHVVEDSATEPDTEPDVVLPTGHVVFTPLSPRWAIAGIPATSYSVARTKALIADGQLRDVQGREGVQLAGLIGTTPVRWKVEVHLEYNGKPIEYPDLEFELTGPAHLTALIQNDVPGSPLYVIDPRIEGLVNEAQTTLAEMQTFAAGLEDSATQAETSATQAAGSAAAASGSATSAATSATAAQTARTGAETARTGAQTARTGAETARSQTEGFAGTAETHASTAATKAAEALASAVAAANTASSFGLSATATTGAAGSSAGVTVSGTGPAYTLNLTIPRGDKGDKGDDGEVSQAALDAAVATLVDNAPEALNTLSELATSLGNDPNFATTTATAIGERAKIDGAPAAYNTLGKLVAALQNHELGGSTDASLLTGALTDQVDASAATVEYYSILSGLTSTVRVDRIGEVATAEIGSTFGAAIDSKADIGHTHPVSDLSATGTASASTFLRGDGSWATPTNTTYSVPSQAEAEAGTATTGRAFSAQRVRQAINAHPRVAAAPATWRWNGTTLPTAASQVHAQARVGDFIVAPNLTTDPGWHQITGV